MKTKFTIKIDAAKSIVVQPTITGASGVRFSLVLFGADMASAVLDAEQCAALILGIQIAGEQAEAGQHSQAAA
jgi:hypothetical protein